jgi:hypothetical protein
MAMDAALLVLLNLGGITALPYPALGALLPVRIRSMPPLYYPFSIFINLFQVVMGKEREPNNATMVTQ